MFYSLVSQTSSMVTARQTVVQAMLERMGPMTAPCPRRRGLARRGEGEPHHGTSLMPNMRTNGAVSWPQFWICLHFPAQELHKETNSTANRLHLDPTLLPLRFLPYQLTDASINSFFFL